MGRTLTDSLGENEGSRNVTKGMMDAPRGFEPRLTESESVVLPLDDGAMRGVPLGPQAALVKAAKATLALTGARGRAELAGFAAQR